MSPFQPTRPENRQERRGVKTEHGIHMAVVTNNKDSTFRGRLDVWIPAYGGDPKNERSWVTVLYANPFYGISSYSATQRITGAVTAGQFMGNEQNQFTAGNLDTAPKQGDVMTFGMWTQPPAVGTKVLVAFADGDFTRGYWFAAIPEIAHGMIPAIGKGASGQPEAEFDPGLPEAYTASDIRQVERPAHPSAASYAAQGLAEDPLRGPITTSSLRESPSKVMGFNTPSGHSFAMDDGDEKGTSKLIRLRSAAGNQITMHDDTGMIYIINASGNSWVELSPSGHIDVFGAAGINMATPKSINLHASENVNIHAGKNLKLVGMEGTKIQGTKEMQVTGAKTMIEGIDSLHIHSCKEIMITSFMNIFVKAFNFLVIQGKCFRWNSGTAKEAEQVPPEKPADVDGYQTTVEKAPNREPYKNHDGGGGAGPAAGPAGGVTPPSTPGGIDTAATSLGNDFSLGFNTGLPGNQIPTINTSQNVQIVNDNGNFNVTTTDTTEVTGGLGIQGFTSTLANASTVPTGSSSTGGSSITGFAPPPPADPTTAASAATAALGQLGGQSAMSSIPAAAGGGATGFAKGNNCSRPADGGEPGRGAGPTGQGDEGLSTAKGPEGQISQKEMYDLMIAQGATPEEARLLSAIGMAESAGKFGALNAVSPDLSYGLWQINMIGNLGPARLEQFGLSSNADLFNPATNAKVAWQIYQTQGLGAWGAYTNGSYAQFY